MTTDTGLLERRLMAVHAQLDAVFFRHQQALLDRDPQQATAELASYAAQLLAHIEVEERFILPAYSDCGGDDSEAPVRLFLGEHQNLRRFVAEFGQRLAALRTDCSDSLLLELLDRQATFKNLLLHHDLRERNMLYPLLSRCLSEAAQQRLWAQIEAVAAEGSS